MAKRLWDKGQALDPEILAYSVGDDYLLDLQLVEEDCYGSLAHSQMLAEVGVISAADRDAIQRGLREVLAQHRRGELTISPAEEDVHTAVEGRLVQAVGSPGERLHTGRSRNDQVLTDLRLWIRRRLLHLAERVLDLAEGLLELAGEHELALLPGYTHLRQAMPMTVGLWAAGHAESLEEDLEALWAAYRAAGRSPLGAAAGFGTPLPLDRRRTAELLGFDGLQVNTQTVQSSRGKVESQALFACTLVGRDLASLAWDLQLSSGPELGFFRLPPNVATGSSIMPQKKNPDVLELTRANSAVLQSMLDRVLAVSSRLPSSYHRDFQLTKEPLLKGLALTGQMTRAIELTVRGLELEREAAAAAVADEALATHRALALAAAGMPFREAYRQVGEELERGETPPRPEPEALARSYVVEGSPGSLGLPAASGRLQELRRRWGEAAEALRNRLARLESGEVEKGA